MSKKDPSSVLSQERVGSDLQVLRTWQRLDDGKWVVGMLLRNTSKRQVGFAIRKVRRTCFASQGTDGGGRGCDVIRIM